MPEEKKEEKTEYQKFLERSGVEIESKQKVLRPGVVKPIQLGNPDMGWIVSNLTDKKVMDCDTIVLANLADIVGTIIKVLIEKNILGGSIS